jgi:HPt (histidine-containing phosphotransfer) domain-containing protein
VLAGPAPGRQARRSIVANGDGPGESKDGAAAPGAEGWRSEMRRAYASGLEAKLQTLGALMEALAAEPAAAAHRQRLLDAVHKIRGSAGAYGFEELSRIAAEWETVIQNGAAVDLLSGYSHRLDAAARAALARED